MNKEKNQFLENTKKDKSLARLIKEQKRRSKKSMLGPHKRDNCRYRRDKKIQSVLPTTNEFEHL